MYVINLLIGGKNGGLTGIKLNTAPRSALKLI